MIATEIEATGHASATPRPQPPKLLYPALVIAAISVTLFSLIGIAALTGSMPSAYSGAQSSTQSAPTAKPMATGKSPATTHAAAAPCPACGTVESISTVERAGAPTGVGAVAGGLAGALLGNQMGRGNGRTVMTIAGGAGGAYLGNRIEQNSRRWTAYRIAVRLDNGSLRIVDQAAAPTVAVGSPVHIIGNSVVPRP